MEVKQVYDFVNTATQEAIGESGLIQEDLSNLVDVGDAVFNANALDKYVKSLVNHIGKVVVVNRVYKGQAPDVLMDGWEFGSVLEKIATGLPEATENESWELQNGASYDPNIFYKPEVVVKFYNSKVALEIPMSFGEKQVRQSFSNGAQLNAFVSMLYNSVAKSLTVKLESLIMRTINNMIGETIYADYQGGDLGATSGVKAINLLYLFKRDVDANSTLTASDCIFDKQFIRYANYVMGITKTRLAKMSTLFNVGGQPRFTPEDMLHVVLLNEFANASDSYLSSDTYHDEFVKLPKHEKVAYWQGSGQDYDLADTSKIYVTTSGGHEVEASGILGVMFDHDALGVCNQDNRVTSNYNPKAEFYTNFNKFDAQYFNDLNENFVVFFVADED